MGCEVRVRGQWCNMEEPITTTLSTTTPQVACQDPDNAQNGFDWCPIPAKRSTIDCDGDGFADPYCFESDSDRSYFLQSTNDCHDTKSDNSQVDCIPVCPRPSVKDSSVGNPMRELEQSLGIAQQDFHTAIKPWCSDPDHTYSREDCDRDGVPDPVCRHTATNRTWIYYSNNNCKFEGPRAKCAKGSLQEFSDAVFDVSNGRQPRPV